MISYVFRGEDVDLEVTERREPYEWRFCGMTPAEHDALNVTDEEEATIYETIATALYERAASD